MGCKSNFERSLLPARIEQPNRCTGTWHHAADSIRAELLSLVGYETQLMEFIDMEHTPKNILIRAYKTGRKPAAGQFKKYKQFTSLLSADPFLENELKEYL